MVSILDQHGNTSYGVMTFTVDTPAELSSIPTNCAIGSAAIVISTGSVYMLNGRKEWVEI